MRLERPPLVPPAVGLAVAYAIGYALSRGLSAWIAPTATGPAQRIGLACAALLPALAVLLLMIVVQSTVRVLTGTIDPTTGRDGRFLQVNQRVITNTVEQLTIFVPALMALASRVRPDLMHTVVAIALLFAIARVAFWIGYLLGPRLRAPGMAVTLLLNVLTLGGAAWVWLA